MSDEPVTCAVSGCRCSLPPSEDRIELARIINEYFEEAYERLMFGRRVPWMGFCSPAFMDEFREATSFETYVEVTPPLSALPIITRDEAENHYGTSGDLDPRGYWMPLDEKATL